MSVLPRVSELTRERVAREFDDLGPQACLVEIKLDLQQHNPELLDMALQWAADMEDPPRVIMAFGMFYRLLTAEVRAPLGPSALSPLPRVSVETRNSIVAQIDKAGADHFSLEAIDHLEASNPELLQMAHGFAVDYKDYARTMQGVIRSGCERVGGSNQIYADCEDVSVRGIAQDL
jgi:hypothetical protein